MGVFGERGRESWEGGSFIMGKEAAAVWEHGGTTTYTKGAYTLFPLRFFLFQILREDY
jgi:hypothetical protein